MTPKQLRDAANRPWPAWHAESDNGCRGVGQCEVCGWLWVRATPYSVAPFIERVHFNGKWGTRRWLIQ